MNNLPTELIVLTLSFCTDKCKEEFIRTVGYLHHFFKLRKFSIKTGKITDEIRKVGRYKKIIMNKLLSNLRAEEVILDSYHESFSFLMPKSLTINGIYGGCFDKINYQGLIKFRFIGCELNKIINLLPISLEILVLKDITSEYNPLCEIPIFTVKFPKLKKLVLINLRLNMEWPQSLEYFSTNLLYDIYPPNLKTLLGTLNPIYLREAKGIDCANYPLPGLKILIIPLIELTQIKIDTIEKLFLYVKSNDNSHNGVNNELILHMIKTINTVVIVNNKRNIFRIAINFLDNYFNIDNVSYAKWVNGTVVSLKCFFIANNFNHIFESSIEKLVLHFYKDSRGIIVLPTNLKELTVSCNDFFVFKNLPKTLDLLNYAWGQKIDVWSRYNIV